MVLYHVFCQRMTIFGTYVIRV